MTEPLATAVLLAICGSLLAASVLLSRASERFNVPLVVVFLGLGLLAGIEQLGGIAFSDYALTYRLGTTALVFILFDGGLNTPMDAVRSYAAPSAVLATVGVAGTATLVALAAHAFGIGWGEAALIGAVISSTDAAAVFSVLRASGLQLRRRLGATLELESGFNDPVAVILTLEITHALAADRHLPVWGVVGQVILEIVVGVALGLGIGYLGRKAVSRVRLPAAGLYAVLLVAIALLAFAVPTLLNGSGFLAVYLAGVMLGNSPIPYRAGLLRVNDALAWLAQITMFLLLGLLVSPMHLVEVAPMGIAIALFLAIVARPVMVPLCLAPFGYTAREIGAVSWVGLRGAVPIVLATLPVMAGLSFGERIFDLVFFVVLVNTIIPGATVRLIVEKLGLGTPEPPAAAAVLEIASFEPLSGQLLSFYIDEALPVVGEMISDLPIPAGAAVTMIVREQTLIAPRGHTVLQPGDHVYVLTSAEDLAFVQLIFGRPENS